MNIYDTANTLANEIRKSTEYIEYKKLKNEINQIPEIKEKIDNFEKMKYDVQLQAMKEKTAGEEKMTQMQNMFSELVQDDKIRMYLDAEYKFNVLMVDINKIISEAIKDLLV